MTPPSSAKLFLSRNGGASAASTPTGAVPAPPNSLLGGGILTNALAQFQSFQPGEDAPLFVRLNEDDVFTQLMEQDFELDKKESKPPTSTGLLLEPLDLPKSNEPFMESPFPFRGPPSSNRSSTVSPPSSLGLDMMPVFPLGNNSSSPMYFNNGCSGFPPLSPPSSGWMHDQDVATPSGCNFQRVHMAPMGVKHLMPMQSMPPMMQQSSGLPELFSQTMTSSQLHPMTPSLWISASRTSAPEAPIEETKDRNCLARPPFSLTISPPASLTSRDVNSLKELIVSADYGSPLTPSAPLVSRPKRARSVKTEAGPPAKCARTTSASPVGQENVRARANGKVTKGKKCIEPNCTRRAQSNSRCKAHGGGARCQYRGPGGCNRSSQGGGFCRAHGGGKRCEFPGCTRGQQRKGRCYVHGGIRRCQFGSCEKKDRGNGFCISHGGGKRCEHPGCSRAVRRGALCQVHETQQEFQPKEETLSL